MSEIASTHPSAAVIVLTERPGAVSVATDVARRGRIAVFTNAIAIVRRLAAGVLERVYFPDFLLLGRLGASHGLFVARILGGGFLVAGVLGYAGVLCVDGVLVVARLLGVIGLLACLDSRAPAITGMLPGSGRGRVNLVGGVDRVRLGERRLFVKAASPGVPAFSRPGAIHGTRIISSSKITAAAITTAKSAQASPVFAVVARPTLVAIVTIAPAVVRRLTILSASRQACANRAFLWGLSLWFLLSASLIFDQLGLLSVGGIQASTIGNIAMVLPWIHAVSRVIVHVIAGEARARGHLGAAVRRGAVHLS